MSNIREYIKTIKPDTNDSIETAGEVFGRIYKWLENLTPEKTLSTIDVQTILQSSAILHIYYKMFGTQLETNILSNSKQNCGEHLRKSFDKFQFESPLVLYSTKILQTKNCVNHIHSIEFYIRAFLTENELLLTLENVSKQQRILNQPSQELSIWENIKRKENLVSNKRSEIIYLVNQAFQFRNEDIEIAINRLISHLSFEYIAWIFLEKPEAQSFEKCAIIQNEICKQLRNFSINNCFLKSIYNISSADSEGLNLFYQSLSNDTFAKSLILFFLGYLSSFKNINEFDQPISIQFISFDFHQLTFIIGAALSLRSPIRIDFYNALNCNNCIPIDLINIINQQKFIYDF